MTRRQEAQQIVAELRTRGYALHARPKRRRFRAALALLAWAGVRLEVIWK